jgi:choline dehydrogenase-like flavoprotein
MPSVGDFDDICEHAEGYGRTLKNKCRRSYGTLLAFAGIGEMLPHHGNNCDIDSTVMDEWGIPVLRFTFHWSDNEIRMAKDMQDTLRSIAEALGGTYIANSGNNDELPFGISVGGENSHELGTVRMGANRKTSVLNGFCQTHDVTNVFVADGACFTSSPEKPPTLTIMAIAWRASEYLVQEARKSNL